ncbi:hypothetical protein PSEUBRA_001909 [Kalmanozyma brasiliensis GHG001]|uniref:uncharacterized protein n=1 Tax=Kalmanozyma brasiliensis (strain GHG001) TaxID=1365824 RepID=UPI00286804B4|nr:uncharacterized protein PSEUBRA_001909 [Kalmanozyma brasiliensis GHG001]KAF6767014.1 hypothetical protein PSEUBRA_001909 [Kalmanozyma brasiliensis GHG001]
MADKPFKFPLVLMCKPYPHEIVPLPNDFAVQFFEDGLWYRIKKSSHTADWSSNPHAQVLKAELAQRGVRYEQHGPDCVILRDETYTDLEVKKRIEDWQARIAMPHQTIEPSVRTPERELEAMMRTSMHIGDAPCNCKWPVGRQRHLARWVAFCCLDSELPFLEISESFEPPFAVDHGPPRH